MSAVGLAVLAALGWGASDYLGGRSSGRTFVLSVIAVTELLGAVALVPALAATGAPHWSTRLALAAVAGLSVALELGIIYAALSADAAFITAPVGALGAAIAATAGVVGGDRLTPAIAVALGCAIVGGAVSGSADGPGRGRLTPVQAVLGCMLAATAVATTLITLHLAARHDPLWATAIEHVSTGASAGFGAAVTALRGRARRRLVRRRLIPARRELAGLALVALTGTGGDLAFAAAATGPLSTVSAVSSLYPIPTILLAAIVQRRRPRARHAVGIAIALAGAAMLGSLTA